MASTSIPPLRYQKGTNGSSPNKPLTNRPLSDLSPMAIRRNSPSFPQGRTSLFKNDSSPANSSPFSNAANSPHMFWQQRDPASPSRENQNPADTTKLISPSKRSSIENLKKASRVKNSNIFAKEQQHLYDPARPTILDGRPSTMQLQGNTFSGRASDSFVTSSNNSTPSVAVRDMEPKSELQLPAHPCADAAPPSPSKQSSSPTKSSLSKRTGANFRYSSFDPDNGIWEDEDDHEKKLPEGRGLHRHAKSVTFDQAPPQINEYEMTTPVPSSIASGSREGSYESFDDEEEDMSFERGSSMDHDDSFDASLEDTDKTPVVLPEDWRFMSPETANTYLSQHEEDVFEDDVGSPAPSAQPGNSLYRPHQTSVNSVDSNGQTRPLPPLPPMGITVPALRPSRDSLSGTIERMSSGQRALPFPPQAASITKSDLRSMSRDSISIEDRLRLMMLSSKDQESDQMKSNPGSQHEKCTSRTDSKETNLPRSESSYNANDDSMLSVGTAPVDDLAPRLDRLSILKQLRGTHQTDNESDSKDDDSQLSPSVYDPDVPIPSLEDPTQRRDQDLDEVAIKQEESDDDNGLYSIPDMYCHSSAAQSEADDEETSQYSQPSIYASLSNIADQSIETPRAQSPLNKPLKENVAHNRMSLPDFMDFGDHNTFNLGFESYLTPPTETADTEKPLPKTPEELIDLPDLEALRLSIQRPYTPEEQLEPPKLSFSGDESSADPGTPNSVIRHPISTSPEPEIVQVEEVPEPLRAADHARSTFEQEKALSVEPSPEADSTPAESLPVIESASQEKAPAKRVSSLVQLEISQDSLGIDLGLGLEEDFDRVVESQKVAFELSLQRLYHSFHGRFPSSEIPVSKDIANTNPMENVPLLPKPYGARALPNISESPSDPPPPVIGSIANRSPHRQRGYLMRQNTKMVVASEHTSREEPQPPPCDAETSNVPVAEPNEVRPSSRKTSQPTWIAEPWNPKSRRRSIRVGGEKATAKRKPADAMAPPLPGPPAQIHDNLGAVAEDELAEEEAEDLEDGVERGRLFVKVIGVKDLQLPFPQHERTQFALTLDNGLHCVTTAWLDLAREAPIGQEFELVVLNDLEFQLTLQMKLEEPKIERAASPTKPPPSPKKQGAFGRLFGSPKKKKESDVRNSQILEVGRRPVTPPSAYELVQGLVAKDGSFARAYVSLSEHEKQSYGRPYFVDIKCFNEWAMEEVAVGSSRSKKSVSQLQRRPPYEIGKLELQLLYVPKPRGAKDEDMPKSMNGAMRALREAEEKAKQQANIKEFEGYLSQQGGDCPFWRRRFFKLVGSKFTAYHESTLQPRATINLNKANKLIDDKSALTQRETSTKGGGRRKSAFAEEEEGYMFVEEGFRIRFANGEVIDFYADSPAQKDEWMLALSQVVGKNIVPSATSSTKGWTEMVLKREKSVSANSRADVIAKRASKDVRSHEQIAVSSLQSHAVSSPSEVLAPAPASALPRPSGYARPESYQAGAGSRSQASSPVKSRTSQSERRLKSRSMAF